MNGEISMHDVVALLADMPAENFSTRRPITLRRGDVGTVVMTYDGRAFEVEFAGRDGRAYALLTVPADRLMALHFEPSQAAGAA
jgi:hypothetical protein